MSKHYDLIVVGAGSAGLTAVQFATELGVRVALVEKDKIGGDCTWSGCVPSKALLHVAKTAHAVRTADQVGVLTQPPQVDMKQVKAYIDKTIADIYKHESPAEIKKWGADLYFGTASFLDAHRLHVGDDILEGKKFILATGAHPTIPAISGLTDVPFFTYEQLFANERLPSHLIIIGAGPIGLEMGQAYARLGAQVTIVDEVVLPAAEPEVGQLMTHLLAKEGVTFVDGLVTAVSHQEHQYTIHVMGDKEQTVQGDMLLVATGRRPNVNGLNLEKAGVVYSSVGIEVDNQLATAQKHIFAVGDCIGGPQFTHLAGWQGFTAARNALVPGSSKGKPSVMGWTTFTDPEIAHIGLTEADAWQQYGAAAWAVTQSLDRVDRAVTDNATAGFIKIVRHKNGRVLGATIVAPRAGEMISELSVAITNGIKIRDIADTIHPYPSYSVGVQLVAADEAKEDFFDTIVGKIVKKLV